MAELTAAQIEAVLRDLLLTTKPGTRELTDQVWFTRKDVLDRVAGWAERIASEVADQGEAVAWLCEFMREDDTTSREVVLENPECTRWADMPDGDGVSPYRVTPLYTRPAAPGWKPIETAPKDGTWIVIVPRDGCIAIAQWTEYPGNPVEGPDGSAWMYGWMFREDYAHMHPGMEEGFLGWEEDPMPTHWMPLPAAPSPQEVK